MAFFDSSQDFSLKGFFKFLPWFRVFIMVCVFTLEVLPERIRFSFLNAHLPVSLPLMRQKLCG